MSRQARVARALAALRSRFGNPKRVGEGGFGVVLSVEDRQLGRRVALKLLLNPEASAQGTDDGRARFLQEARLASHLRHPNVVQAFDYGEADDVPYIVYELIDGEDLETRLRAHPDGLPPNQVLGWLEALLEGLRAAHAAGVLHRDVKPANALLTRDGRVVLVDFGLGRIEGSEIQTRKGLVLGTPTYMPPERLLGEPATASDDVYALGVVAYELMTGQEAWGALSDEQMATVKIGGMPLRFPASAAHVSAPARQLVERWTAPRRAARPASADEALAQLRAVRRGATPSERPRDAGAVAVVTEARPVDTAPPGESFSKARVAVLFLVFVALQAAYLAWAGLD